MSVFDVFEKVAAVSGKNAKADIIGGLDLLERELFTWAMDPGRVYFVRVDENKLTPHPRPGSDATIIDQARQLLRDLADRAVTGDAAKAKVQALLSYCGPLQQKWLARIINKDLRVGVDTAFHDAWPDDYKVFEPQLCKSWEDQDVEGYPYEDKWNGLRALAVPNKAGVHGWYSRNGKPIPGMDAVSEELAQAKMPLGAFYTFDGEGFGGDWDDQVGQSVSKIRGNKGYEDITFNVFDMIIGEEWDSLERDPGFKTEPLEKRRQRLELFFTMNPQLRRVHLVRQGRIDTASGITPIAARDEAISRGLEGIILKNPKASYRPGKHTNGWYKFKKRNPADVTIVDAVEGTKRLRGKLGAIVVKGPVEAFDKNGKPKGIVDIAPTEIGTGFTDLQREEFWQMHLGGKLAGLTCEVEWGEITKDLKLFHTAFKRMRFDK